MPERIEGAPDSLSVNDDRIVYLVGQSNTGGLELLPVARLVQSLETLARTALRGKEIEDIFLFSVADSPILDIDFASIAGEQAVRAKYRNSGDKDVLVKIKNKQTGSLSSGDIKLQPGAEEMVGFHQGFTAQVDPTQTGTLTSFLEVTEFA